MTPRLPRITASEVLRALDKDGWREVRSSGSHRILAHDHKPGLVTVAYHSGNTILPKTLKAILEQAQLSVDDLRRML
jgi:predicted RNA binding protein YcfA (HicA-like mRNA interferase family)